MKFHSSDNVNVLTLIRKYHSILEQGPYAIKGGGTLPFLLFNPPPPKKRMIPNIAMAEPEQE